MKKFIFLAGHHRSGTSLLHEILRTHPEVTGLTKTGKPEDEGQHVQSVYRPAIAFGGPGKYIFNPRSIMKEDHELATAENAEKVFSEWKPFLDESKEYVIEKSPPNLVRSRFLQKLFPESKFVVILRHPLAIAYATKKWSKTSIESLLDHTLKGYEIFEEDRTLLKASHVLRYEEFVEHSDEKLKEVCEFLGLSSITSQQEVRSDVNEKYFKMWEDAVSEKTDDEFFQISDELEARMNRFGYSIRDYRKLLPSEVLGSR